jgi:hypothetical protein
MVHLLSLKTRLRGERLCFLQSAVGGWQPVSVVKGAGTANQLVTQLDSLWGRTLLGNSLIRNIAQSLYKDCKTLEKTVRSQVPFFFTLPPDST